jgi:exodeoxyribonuclease (lambda-induced)
MRYIICDQGTEAWLQARAGVITASRFSDAISILTRASGDKKAGDPTAAADKYAGDVAIERISGKPYGEPVNAWTLKRGHELEAMARPAYELRTGNIAEEAGIVKTDDGEFGYSTDGLVNPSYDGDQIISCEGLIEIKCPVDSVKIRAMLETGDVSEYMHQMQGGMWITGAKWCDFIQYVPDLESVGNDLFVKRVMRDEKFIEEMSAGLMKFRQRVGDFKFLYSKKAAADVAAVTAHPELQAA